MKTEVIFDITKFDSYKEDNRREVKRANGGLPLSLVPRGVVIRQENDMLILENLGSIRVGKYQMKLGGESDPRNKALMKMFNLIDIGERAGSGVPELFAVWEQEGWEEPQIEERQDSVERTTVRTQSYLPWNLISGTVRANL